MDQLDDSSAATILDEYLIKLQTGSPADREALLAEHPKLAKYIDCLEALDQLAPPTTSLAPLPGDVDATVGPAKGAAARTPPAQSDFGKFELLEELGRGGMGVVYKARQKDLGRIVALKMVLAGPMASQETVERFRDEARAVAGIQHPNITTVYEVGDIHGQGYIAIQFVGGSSLTQRLARGGLQPHEAARIVSAVARAVDHLHKNGVVHRDLKPSNILIDDDGKPYVTDFGLVKLLQGDSHKTTTGAVLGTPSYMSPEQAAAKSSEVGPLSDVYSVGAVLYECLTGRPPFHEATALDTLVQVLEGEPPTPRSLRPSIPRDLEKICLRCLEKSPERRYQSAAALANDLDRYLKGEAIEGLKVSTWHHLERWARREPGLAARLAALLACLVLIQVHYLVDENVNRDLHFKVVALILAWCGTAVVFQKVQNTGRWPADLPFAWSGADMFFWTVVLLIDGEAPMQPVLIGYGCLIAASGLWFQVRLVWFTLILSLLSYGGVLAAAIQERGEPPHSVHMDMIFAVGLVVLANVVAYQVHRVRALSRYYEHRPLPK
jgi:eukaryotic-like serine/threonine-protein kinase